MLAVTGKRKKDQRGAAQGLAPIQAVYASLQIASAGWLVAAGSGAGKLNATTVVRTQLLISP